MSEIILSPGAPAALGAYPHARRVGNLLYISGTGPRRRGEESVAGVELDAGGRVVRYDIEAQCRAVFDNVRTILEDAGSSWEHLVDVTVFLTDLERDFPTYNRIYGEYFGAVQPCRTTIGVAKLPGPIAIELKCIATLPCSTRVATEASHHARRGAAMTRKAHDSPRLVAPAGPYSQAVRCGDHFHISGQVGRDPATGRLVDGGIAAQTACIFRNFRTLLGELGCGLDDVLKVTVYLANMADFAEMNRVYAENFHLPYPARTTVGVHELPLGALIVMEMVIRAPPG